VERPFLFAGELWPSGNPSLPPVDRGLVKDGLRGNLDLRGHSSRLSRRADDDMGRADCGRARGQRDSGMSGCEHAADAKSGGHERCRLKPSGELELDTLNRERRRGSGRCRCGPWTPRHQRPIRAATAGVDQQSRDPVGHGI